MRTRGCRSSRPTRFSGALPVGVPDPRPERAQVVFVDETDCPGGECRELARRDLVHAGTGSSLWDNSANPVSLTVESSGSASGWC